MNVIRMCFYFLTGNVTFVGELVILFMLSFIIFKVHTNLRALAFEEYLSKAPSPEFLAKYVIENSTKKELKERFKIMKAKFRNKVFERFKQDYLMNPERMETISYLLLILSFVYSFMLTVVYDPNVMFIIVFITFFGFFFVRNFIFFATLQSNLILDKIKFKTKIFRELYLKFNNNKKKTIEAARNSSHRMSEIFDRNAKFFEDPKIKIKPIVQRIQSQIQDFDRNHKSRMYALSLFLLFMIFVCLQGDFIYQKSAFNVEDNTFGLIKTIIGINSISSGSIYSLSSHLVLITFLYFLIHFASYTHTLSLFSYDQEKHMFLVTLSEEDYLLIKNRIRVEGRREIEQQKKIIARKLEIDERKISSKVRFYQFENPRNMLETSIDGVYREITLAPIIINSTPKINRLSVSKSQRTFRTRNIPASPTFAIPQHRVPTYNLDVESNKLLFYYYNYMRLMKSKLYLGSGMFLCQAIVSIVLMLCFSYTDNILFVVYILLFIYYSIRPNFYTLNNVGFIVAALILIKLILNMLNIKKAIQANTSKTILEFIEEYFNISIYNTTFSKVFKLDDKTLNLSVYLDILVIIITIIASSLINLGLSLLNTFLEEHRVSGHFNFIKLRNGSYTINLKKVKDHGFQFLKMLVKMKYAIVDILVIGILLVNFFGGYNIISILGLVCILTIEITFGFFRREIIKARIITYKIAMIVILILSFLEVITFAVKKIFDLKLFEANFQILADISVSSLQNFIYQYIIAGVFLSIVVDPKFIDKSRKLLDEANLVSLLKVICRMYTDNEKTMFAFLKDYKVKEHLENEIKSTITFVDRWKNFTVGRTIEEEQKLERSKKKEIAEFLANSFAARDNSSQKKFRQKYFDFLNKINGSLVDEFLNMDTLELFDMLLEHNRLIFHNEFELNIRQFLRGDFRFIKDNIVLLKERYRKIYDKININGSHNFFLKTDIKIAIMNNKLTKYLKEGQNIRNSNLILKSIATSKIHDQFFRANLPKNTLRPRDFSIQKISRLNESKLGSLIARGNLLPTKTGINEIHKEGLKMIFIQKSNDVNFKYVRNKKSVKNTNLLLMTLETLIMLFATYFEFIMYSLFFLNLFLNGGVIGYGIIAFMILKIIVEPYKKRIDLIVLLILQLVQCFKVFVNAYYKFSTDLKFIFQILFGADVLQIDLFLIVMCYITTKFLKFKGHHLHYRTVSVNEDMTQCYIRMRINDLFQYLITQCKIDPKYLKIKNTRGLSKKGEKVERNQLKDLYSNLSYKLRSIFFHLKTNEEKSIRNLLDESGNIAQDNARVFEKIPKIDNSKYITRIFSPYNFKSGVTYGTTMSFVLLINFIVHLFVGHVIVGDDFSLWQQISNSVISYKQLILITVLLILIIIEFYLDNKRSFHWYFFYNSELTKSMPHTQAAVAKQVKVLFEKNFEMENFGNFIRP